MMNELRAMKTLSLSVEVIARLQAEPRATSAVAEEALRSYFGLPQIPDLGRGGSGQRRKYFSEAERKEARQRIARESYYRRRARIKAALAALAALGDA